MDDATTAEVTAVLEAMAKSYGAKDVAGVLAHFAGDDAILVGTGPDEVRFGAEGIRQQLRRDIAQSDELDMTFEDVRVSALRDAAFAYADTLVSAVAGGRTVQMPMRVTAGLVRTGQGWRIVQFHASVAADTQPAGHSFPA